MLSLLCDKHEEEWRQNHVATPRLPHEGWFTWSMRVKRTDNSDCPDCRIVGLSKRGKVKELDKPEDWMFHD